MTLHAGPLPKYYQLAAILRERIQRKELQPGDKLPPEEALCREFQVSRGTVRQAVQLLVQEGLVRREQGRGTFITPPQPSGVFFTLTSFNEDMQQQGRTPNTVVLKAEKEPAPIEVAQRLQLQEGEEVFHIERLRMADSTPVAYEIRYLAVSLCPQLLEEDLSHDAIHTLLIEKYHIPLLRTVHTIEVKMLSGHEAKLLQAPPNSPAFAIDRLTFTTGPTQERPAVWYRALYRGDEYHFRAEFEMK